MPYPFLVPHADLSISHGIPVVFYDQIGCGRSTHLPEKSKEFWTVDFFKDELDNLLAHLGVAGEFDLFGHSWGGMLAAEYAATRQPRGLRRLVLADTPASMELWEAAAEKLLARFPSELRDMLKRHEREGTTDAEEYQEGVMKFYRKHVCKVDPWPQEIIEAIEESERDETVYHAMWGPSEFYVTGSLKKWSIIDQIHTISYPTLLINGAEDEAQDESVTPFVRKLPKVKWVQFAGSSHTPFYEEKERYITVVDQFLTS
ncbi:hypothetical protein EW146_g148 [Bondarzewia mesenterica]|uniref:AB hydrolase-1 domain-containing protein n=1 Tax=Bondarzewia mesenterica TaxID=1095465 RepID=A0A4S4ME70_9AGAM|nr:hypothetical protein EW146_g148 [Bondarzewia mesenterica]